MPRVLEIVVAYVASNAFVYLWVGLHPCGLVSVATTFWTGGLLHDTAEVETRITAAFLKISARGLGQEYHPCYGHCWPSSLLGIVRRQSSRPQLSGLGCG